MSKLNPQVYRDAAESLIERSDIYCCFAIEKATFDGGRLAHQSAFAALFEPPKSIQTDIGTWWAKSWGDQEARIFALLLMSEMIENPYEE